MNRARLLEAAVGLKPTYVVAVDIETKLAQFTAEFQSTDVPSFYNWNARGLFRDSPHIHYVKDSPNPKFQPDAKRVIGSGKSVTYTCLQLAFYLGFREVILVGKDHDYGVSSKPHELITATGNEGSWFIPGYHAAGMQFRAPDFYGEEHAYRLAREAFERAGRRVVDATVGGKLNVFEKVDLVSLF
jgi:hypothetical protein